MDRRTISKIKTYILACSVTFMAVAMIILPEDSFQASLRGLTMWWEIVFPSLFPFFVLSELLIGFGVVTFIGVLLEPLMKPLFKVSGIGGFAWAMGMASGFPAGAKITARLRQEGQLTQAEAIRLASFTNSSSPLFIFGAVAVGFFHNPKLGFLLAACHYLGNFAVGLIMRFYGKDENKKKTGPASYMPDLKQALRTLHQTRLDNNKPLGKLLGDAVISSIHTLLMIGGFIILFSVLNKLLFHAQITPFLASILQWFLPLFDLPRDFGNGLIAGMFEITLGSQMVSGLKATTLMQQAIVVSFILGFSGFSVHAQVASILADAGIDFKPFFIARICHGFISAFFAFLLWQPFNHYFNFYADGGVIPVFWLKQEAWWSGAFVWLTQAGPLITIFCLLLYIIFFVKKMDLAK